MTSSFDVKFAAYERAMKQNNNFGLAGEELAQQYGRYATGLQYAEQKAENKKFGKELAKEKATQKQEAAQAKQTKQASSEAIAELNKKQAIADKQRNITALTKKSKKIDQQIAEQKRKLNKTNAKTQKQNIRSKIDRLNSEKQKLSNEINSIQQETKGSPIAETGVKELGAGAEKELEAGAKKLGAGAEKELEAGAKKLGAGAKSTGAKTGILKSIKNAVKGKKGKVALGAAALAATVAIGVGIYKLCTNKDKEEVDAPAIVPVDGAGTGARENVVGADEAGTGARKNVVGADEAGTGAKKNVVGADEAGTGAKENVVGTNEADTEVEENVIAADENDTDIEEPVIGTVLANDEEPDTGDEYYTAVSGDSFWNIAKKNLQEKHKDIEGYKPSNKEILEEMNKLLEKNNYKLDENNYYPVPMLHPGAKLNLAV